jgi:hypothetical protein
MNLVDLRKLAIRKQARIRFGLKNGMQCVITETGLARVPDLNATPDFNLETELAGASEFSMEEAAAVGSKGAKPRPVPLSRDQITALTQNAPAGVAVHDDHEDE